MELAKKKKTHRSIEQYIESPRIYPHTYGQLAYNKETKIKNNGETTVSSTSGIGKAGQLHIKQWNYSIPLHCMQK